MKKILAVGAAVLGGLILVWLLLTFGISHPAAQPTPSEYVAREAMAQATTTAVALAGDEALRLAQQSADRDRIVQPAITLLIVVVLVGMAVGLVLVLAGAALAAWHRRHPLILVAGEPVARHFIERGEYPGPTYEIIRARGIAQIEAARRPLVDKISISYSGGKGEALPPVGELPTQLAAFSVPTITQLIDSGTIRPYAPMLRGYSDDGKAIMGEVGDLLSLIVAGLSGSGKTNTTAVLLSQAYLAGAAFIVCDPHSEAEEDSLTSLIQPLADAFVLPVATDDREIMDALTYARDVLAARLNPSKATAQQKVRAAKVEGRPLLVIVDEANKVLARSTIGDKAADVLEEIFAEGRKVKVFAACLAQNWLAARSGGNSALRDQAGSKYVHRLPRQQARLLLPSDLGPAVEVMPTGKAMLATRNGDFIPVTLPKITPADIRRIAEMMRGATQAMPTSLPTSEPTSTPATYRFIEATPEVGNEVGSEVGIYAQKGITPEVVAVVAQMMADEASQKEILAALGWATSGGAYETALKKLRTIQAYIARRAGIANKAVQQ